MYKHPVPIEHCHGEHPRFAENTLYTKKPNLKSEFDTDAKIYLLIFTAEYQI